MIHYSLKCAHGHEFESWFASASAYDTLRKSGHVTCAICGSTDVEKALMAPAVTARKAKQPAVSDEAAPDGQAPAEPAPGPTRAEIEAKIAAIRAHVETNSDYVGTQFATQARAMHVGDAPERAIWGEAKPEEAKELIEEGISIAPLPFIPKSKTN